MLNLSWLLAFYLYKPENKLHTEISLEIHMFPLILLSLLSGTEALNRQQSAVNSLEWSTEYSSGPNYILEPEPKVQGLLRRVKRFGCWHSCLTEPIPYVKPSKCEEGSPCRCLLDLLGHIHSIACDVKGRDPMESEQRKPIDAGHVPWERKLQCNYKTCWTTDEDPSHGGAKALSDKIASVVSGIYSGGKCNCGQQRIFPLNDIRPAALNHVHQRENYKFALNYQVFPDEDGQCVCKFGRSLGGEGHHTEEEYSESEEGVRHKEMGRLENDELRHIFQCGIRGCRHVFKKVNKFQESEPSNSSTTPKPWYLMELERSRVIVGHEHKTATTVICNLKTCWRVDDRGEEILTQEKDGRVNEGDQARNSIQLSLKQKQLLIRQRGEVKGTEDQGDSRVYCTHGICSWVQSSDKGKSGNAKGKGNELSKNGEDEIIPGKDGLCPCHKAYVTYFNWRH